VTAERKWPYSDEEAVLARLRSDAVAARARGDLAEAERLDRIFDSNKIALEKLKRGRRGTRGGR
jgi:hypothetical protein